MFCRCGRGSIISVYLLVAVVISTLLSAGCLASVLLYIKSMRVGATDGSHQVTPDEVCWLRGSSLSHYQILFRLLDDGDAIYLQQQLSERPLGGWPDYRAPRIMRQFKAGRRRVALGYLRELCHDVDQLRDIAWRCSAHSSDRIGLALFLVRNRVVFAAACAGLRAQLALSAVGAGTVFAAEPLLSAAEELHARTMALALASA